MTKGFFPKSFLKQKRARNNAEQIAQQHPYHALPLAANAPSAHWDFSVVGAVETPQRWTWEEFQLLPREPVSSDIHDVSGWSKFDSKWSGVAVETLLRAAIPQANFILAFCEGDYIMNIPLIDVLNRQAWIVDSYDSAPLPIEHGGPLYLLVPNLYFWKSAKWVRGLRVVEDDQPAFWESLGYHHYGDPWKDQRHHTN